MAKISHISIHLDTFKTITGIDFDYFAKHALKGDDWGSFLKLVSVIESCAKRAIGIKVGVDPELESVGRIEFATALLICRDASLISGEAFNFANELRQVRNGLAHKGGVLHLDVSAVLGTKHARRYPARVHGFIMLEGSSVTAGTKEHLNILFAGCVGFVAQLASGLFGENWCVEDGDETDALEQ